MGPGDLKAVVTIAGLEYHVDLNRFHDISIAVAPQGAGARSNFAPYSEVQPLKIGDFVGSVKKGASCNVDALTLVPHCQGTHTECFGHVHPDKADLLSCLREVFVPARLISVDVFLRPDGETVINKDGLAKALGSARDCEALVIRTRPNDPSKRQRDYSGTNPPYLELSAVEYLVSLGVRHLLLDVPSIDREVDAKLLGHKTFWGLLNGDSARRGCTITEFVYIPNEILDGRYLLSLQVPGLPSDAAPSRALLFDLAPIR